MKNYYGKMNFFGQFFALWFSFLRNKAEMLHDRFYPRFGMG